MKWMRLVGTGMFLLWAFSGRAESKDWGTKHRHGAVKLGYWSASSVGEVKFAEEVAGFKIGGNLDLEKDLKLSNPQMVPEVVVDLRPTKRNRFYLSYFQSRYLGENTRDLTPQPLEFLGTKFTGDVQTAFEVNRYKGFYQFSPFALKRGFVGFLLGANYYLYNLELEGKVNGTNLRKTETATFPLFIPVAGVDGQFTLGYGLGLFGHVSGISFNFSGVESSYLDALAGVQFKVSRLYSSLGYQFLNWKLNYELSSDQTGNFNLSQQGLILHVGVNL